MSAVSTLLGLVGVIVLVVAVIALARGQLRWAHIANRKVAGAVLAGGFVVMIAGTAMASPAPTVHNSIALPATTSSTEAVDQATTDLATTDPTTTLALPTTTTPLPTTVVTTTTAPRTTTTTRHTTAPRTTTTTRRAPATHTVAPPHTTTRKPAPPVSTVSCTASMSISNPVQYSDTDVDVRTTTAGATVTATAHYKTTTTSHTATASSSGTAAIDFRISGATPGYTVSVSVTVSAHGTQRSCSTSFTPRKK